MTTESKAAAKLAEIVETVALQQCEMAASVRDGDSTCPRVFKDSTDDWCLPCLARKAMTDYRNVD